MGFNVKELIESVSTEKSYIEDLRGISKIKFKDFYTNCERIIHNKEDITDEVRNYLDEIFLPILDCATTFLIPLGLLTLKVFQTHPERLLENTSGKNLANVVVTYEDFYDILRDFPLKSAELILKKLDDNYSVTSKLINSFRNRNKDSFCETLYNSDNDNSTFIHKLFRFNITYKSVVELINLLQDLGNKTDVYEVDNNDGTMLLSSYMELIRSDEDDASDLECILLPLKRLFSLLELVYDEETFLKHIIYAINDDSTRFDETISLFMVMYVRAIYEPYNDLLKNITFEEHKVFEEFRESQPKHYFEYLNNILENLDEESDLESESNNSPELQVTQFLPNDFFNSKDKQTNNYIGNIRQKYASKGVASFCTLIDFIASEGYIDNTDDNKKNFAYKISGYYSSFDKGVVKWYGETNILSVLIQNICDFGDKWKRAEVIFDCERKLHNSSTLRKASSRDKEFAELFQELYDVDLYK